MHMIQYSQITTLVGLLVATLAVLAAGAATDVIDYQQQVLTIPDEAVSVPVSIRLKQPPTGKAFVYCEMANVKLDKCALEFTAANYNTSQTINLVPLPYLNEATANRTVPLKCKVYSENQKDEIHNLGNDLPAMRSKGASATCSASSDPHFVSLKGTPFDYMGTGDFYLVKSEYLTIQTRLGPCMWGTCVTALAIRYGPSIMVLNVTDSSSEALKQVTPLQGATVSSSFGMTYNIAFNGGSTLRINRMTAWLNVYFEAAAYLKSKITGLCGAYGDPTSEFLGGDGQYYKNDITAFAQSHRVPTNDTILICKDQCTGKNTLPPAPEANECKIPPPPPAPTTTTTSSPVITNAYVRPSVTDDSLGAANTVTTTTQTTQSTATTTAAAITNAKTKAQGADTTTTTTTTTTATTQSVITLKSTETTLVSTNTNASVRPTTVVTNAVSPMTNAYTRPSTETKTVATEATANMKGNNTAAPAATPAYPAPIVVKAVPVGYQLVTQLPKYDQAVVVASPPPAASSMKPKPPKDVADAAMAQCAKIIDPIPGCNVNVQSYVRSCETDVALGLHPLDAADSQHTLYRQMCARKLLSMAREPNTQVAQRALTTISQCAFGNTPCDESCAVCTEAGCRVCRDPTMIPQRGGCMPATKLLGNYQAPEQYFGPAPKAHVPSPAECALSKAAMPAALAPYAASDITFNPSAIQASVSADKYVNMTTAATSLDSPNAQTNAASPASFSMISGPAAAVVALVAALVL